MSDSYAPPPSNWLTAAPKLSLAAVLALVVLSMVPSAAFASHNVDYYAAQPINAPSTVLPAYFEGSPFVLTHTNTGTDLVNAGEPITCNFGGDVTHYGRTVYYEIHPNRNGRVRIVAASQTTGFRPVVTLIPYVLSSGNFDSWFCNGSTPPINRATLPSEGYFDVVAGAHYKIQVSGENSPNQAEPAGVPTSGSFQLIFVYDPNSDSDPLFDSQDACPTNDGGPYSIGGCPDGDNDDVRDLDDQCDGQHVGARGIRGCPDSDGDGKVDSPDPGSDLLADNCDREDARKGSDKNQNGCIDYAKLQPDPKLPWTTNFVQGPGGFVRYGVTLDALAVSDIPRRTRVAVRCSSKRTCKSSSKRAGRKRRVVFKSLAGKPLLPGQRVVVRVTGGPLSIGKVLIYTARPKGKKGLTDSVRCIAPKNKSVRSCKSVSTIR